MRRALGLVMVVAAVVLVVVATEVARADPPAALPEAVVARFHERLRHDLVLRGLDVGPAEGLRAGEATALRSELRGYAGTLQVELRTFEGSDGPTRAVDHALARLKDQLRSGRRILAETLAPEATANAWVEVRGAQVVVVRAKVARPRLADELGLDMRTAVDALWRVARADLTRPVWMSVLQQDGSLVVGVDRDLEPTVRGLPDALAKAGLQPRTAVRRAADERVALYAWRSPSRDRLESVLVDRIYQARRGFLDVLPTVR